MSDPYFLDSRLVRRAFDRASATFDANAAVHAELRNRLLERLDVVKLQPQVVLDLGAGTGHAARKLQERYRSAYVLAADISVRMLQQAKKQQGWFKRFGRAACDAHQLGLKTDSVDLVFSNLMLQWCADPDRVFAELARVLRPDGLLTFTAVRTRFESCAQPGMATIACTYIDSSTCTISAMRWSGPVSSNR
jgi:malonyl-CoA O-methyltransferase